MGWVGSGGRGVVWWLCLEIRVQGFENCAEIDVNCVWKGGMYVRERATYF